MVPKMRTYMHLDGRETPTYEYIYYLPSVLEQAIVERLKLFLSSFV